MDCEFCHNTGIAECISIDSHVSCEKCKGKGYYLEEVMNDDYNLFCTDSFCVKIVLIR